MTLFPQLEMRYGGSATVRAAIDADRTATAVAIVTDFWQVLKHAKRKVSDDVVFALFEEHAGWDATRAYIRALAQQMCNYLLAERQFCCGMQQQNEPKSFQVFVALHDDVASFVEIRTTATKIHREQTPTRADGANVQRLYEKWFDYLKSLQRLAYRAKDKKDAQIQLMNRALLPVEVANAVAANLRKLLRDEQYGDCFTVRGCSTPALAAERVAASIEQPRRTIVFLDVPIETMLASTSGFVWIRRIVPSLENGLKNTLQFTTRRLCNIYRASELRVRTLLLRVDARELVIDRDNEDDIDTIELQLFTRAEMQREMAQRRVDALPVPRSAEQNVRELFDAGAVSQCVVLSMFAASVSSAQRIADSAASRQHAAQLTHLAPTAAAAAAAKANAERTRLALNNNVNATQANPIALARPPAQRLPGRRNDGRKSGAQNKSTRPRKLPTQTSPPGQTFGELLPNEWTPAGPLLAAGSLRAYATSLICEVDNTRQQDQRRAVVLASWAVVRPELSLHDAIVQAAAEVAALCIHADSLSDILHTQRMPVQDDDNAKKLATAIRSSSLAIQGVRMLLHIKRSYLIAVVAQTRSLPVQSAGFDAIAALILEFGSWLEMLETFVYPFPLRVSHYAALACDARAYVQRFENLARSVGTQPRPAVAGARVTAVQRTKGLRLLRAIANGGDNGAFAPQTQAPIQRLQASALQPSSFAPSTGANVRYDRLNARPDGVAKYSVGNAKGQQHTAFAEKAGGLICFRIKGLKSGRPLQAIEMPAFFAFKARDDDDDEPFERGIPLTQDPTLYGGVAYRYHDPNGRIELDADYMISTDSGLTAPAVNGGAPPAFDWKVAHAHCIDVTERTTRHDSKNQVRREFLGATLLLPTNMLAPDLHDTLKTINRMAVEAENLLRDRLRHRILVDPNFSPDTLTYSQIVDDAIKQAHFDQLELPVANGQIFHEAMLRIRSNLASQFNAMRMRRLCSSFVISSLERRGDEFDLKPSDRALLFLHLPWWLRSGQSDLVRSNISELDDEADDDDDDDDDDARHVYTNFQLANFATLIDSCSHNVVSLFASFVDSCPLETDDYHNKVRHAMSGRASRQQRDAMSQLRDSINNSLAAFGFDNQHARTALGRCRFVEALQRFGFRDDLGSELAQQLSPSPTTHNYETPLTLTILAASLQQLKIQNFYYPKSQLIRSEEEVWLRLLPNWKTFVENRRLFGQDIADLPYSGSTDGVHIKVFVHFRSMPTAKSIDAAANNRSAKSWFSHSKPTFNDVSSILRSTVHRLTTGGVTFRTGDPRSHRGFLKDYGPVLGAPAPQLDVAAFVARHVLIGCDVGEVVAVAAVGTMIVIKADVSMELWNRYVKVTGAGRRHTMNVRMAAGAGRRYAAEVERRTAAMQGKNDRTLDASTFGEYSRAATDVRATTTAQARDDERVYRHLAYRNRQRWYAGLVNSVASLAVLGGDPLLFMGDYKAKKTRKGSKRGGVPSKAIITALARRFPMLGVDERYTSQKSPITQQQVKLATADEIGRPVAARNRLFVAKEAQGRGARAVLLDRDVSAALNMVLLGLLKLLRGVRPTAFGEERANVAAAAGRRGARGGARRGGRGRGRGRGRGGAAGARRGGRGAAGAGAQGRGARRAAAGGGARVPRNNS